MKRLLLAALAAVTVLAVSAAAQGFIPAGVGSTADGRFALNSGWLLKPAGQQVPLDTLPIQSLLSPDRKYVLVLHAGYRQPSLAVLSAATLEQIDSVPLDDAWFGMSFAPGGRTLYVSGGASAAVYEFGFSEEGKLTRKRTFTIVPRGEKRTAADFTGDVQVAPDGRLLYVAALFRNEVRVINPQSGWVIERFPAPPRPYRILLRPDGKTFFLTSWGGGSVHYFRAEDGGQLAMKRLELQPMDMVLSDVALTLEEDEEAPPWKSRLFVATAATNLVHVLTLTESGDLDETDSIRIGMWPYQPAGMTPTSLALSPDRQRLFVTCADANVVAVVDVSRVKARVLGFIPTGWYPTDATPLDEERVLVLNGKGDGSAPNPNGPDPLKEALPWGRGSSAPGYVGNLQRGSASVVTLGEEDTLFDYTKTAMALSPYSDEQLAGIRGIPEGNPIPPAPEVPPEMRSPIRHVLYIVKGNRGYDQVLGDIGQGNSDAALVRFGEDITPNHHRLAREYVHFDNFYTNGDTGPAGLYWSTGAIAPPFVERLWPAALAGRFERNLFNAAELAAAPPAGFLWSQANLAGLSLRNYGFTVVNNPLPVADGEHVKSVRDPVLRAVTAPTFRGPDPAYPEVERAKAFVSDFEKLDAAGELPRLTVMRLAGDRTSGTESGRLSPRSAMADNDLALGLIVEACTKSKAWPQMAIFVVEADASGGTDHVDAHRSLAFAISPYTRRALVDGTFYNSAAVLRTIELILGLSPMTQFDAAAFPMVPAFAAEPDAQAYEAVKPQVPRNEKNP